MKLTSLFGTALSASLLAACGGGGGGESAIAPLPAIAQGVYAGTLTGSTSPQFQMLVLESGGIYSLYGTTSGGIFLVSGFVQGLSTSSAGVFNASNAKDFGSSLARNSPIAGTYTASNVLNASATYTGLGAVTIAGAPIVNPLYNYNTAPALTDIQGAWSMTDLAGNPVSLAVQSSGAFTGSSGGCGFSGNLTPRATGKNVFNFTVSFGASPCVLANQSATGIGLSYMVGSTVRQLIIAGTDNGRTTGTALFGSR